MVASARPLDRLAEERHEERYDDDLGQVVREIVEQLDPQPARQRHVMVHEELIQAS